MRRVFIAFRAFFAVLFNGATAMRVQDALDSKLVPSKEPAVQLPKPVEPARPTPQKPVQSEAITLLATLQREARLVDFLKEDLSGYSDEQVGAAVREIHRDCGQVVKRMFAIRPIVDVEEGSTIEVPEGFDAARFRLTGKLTGAATFRGTLRHHGWEAAQCELPAFTGSESAARTITPVEVEVS